jgi:hypothetical protein
MKLSLDLGKCRQVNVWLHDLPDAGFEGEERTEIILPAAKASFVRRGALEMLVPIGGRLIYGLLGGILVPANPVVLRVEIHISENRSKRFNGAILKSEKTFVGLPREYVPGIQRALAISGDHIPTLPAGSIKLEHAAHGEVSSNQAIFGHLTISLIKLFSLENIQPVEDELVKMFPERLANEIG